MQYDLPFRTHACTQNTHTHTHTHTCTAQYSTSPEQYDQNDAFLFGWQGTDSSHPSPTTSFDWASLVGRVQNYIRSLNWGYRVALNNEGVTYINAKGAITAPGQHNTYIHARTTTLYVRARVATPRKLGSVIMPLSCGMM